MFVVVLKVYDMKLSMASNDRRQSNFRFCCCSLGIAYEVVKWLAMIGERVIFVFDVVL